jgi:glycosyltransferase involved in cell wall biosynthesis
LFGAPPERVHVVPNGVEEIFLQSRPVARGPWLVCTATITERKRVCELAEAAVRAQTKLWVVGRAYADSDPYAKRFFQLAEQQPELIRFEGAIGDRARMAAVYREARGFVLLSTMESLSLSALEGAACECPLLLSDLPWARTVFGESVSYCPITPDTAKTAAVLRRFYDAAPTLRPPPRPLTWAEVAQQLKQLYETLLKTSR